MTLYWSKGGPGIVRLTRADSAVEAKAVLGCWPENVCTSPDLADMAVPAGQVVEVRRRQWPSAYDRFRHCVTKAEFEEMVDLGYDVR